MLLNTGPPLQLLHVKFASSLHLRFLSHILTKLSFMPDSLNGLFYIFFTIYLHIIVCPYMHIMYFDPLHSPTLP